MAGYNIVDLLIVLALLLYVLIHLRDGFLSLTQRLLAFVGALVLAFLFYGDVASFFTMQATVFPGLLNAASFIILFLIFQQLISVMVGWIVDAFPERVLESSWNRALGIAPAFIDGAISLAIVLFILVVVPIMPDVKRPIEESRLGAPLVNQVSSLEGHINRVFGEAVRETLSLITIPADNGEIIELPYKPRTMTVDEEAERKMLEMVNAERAQMGAPPLVIDQSIVQVARAHSFDMWQKQYFAHENREGETPFDRMERGEVDFRLAGENLALARTLERAHEGLMNSPGHKRNILDPNFGRIGIGVVDGGVHGKMFTQNFAD